MPDRKISWRGAWQAGGTFLKSLVIPGVAGAPAAPVDNEVWIDTTAGRLAARIAGGTVQIPISTDLASAGLDAEGVQDVVGAMFGVDTGDLDFTYDDAGNAISVVIKLEAVTLAKMANLAANSIIGNNTGAAAVPKALTTTEVKALLALTEADITVGATSRVLGRITAGAGPAEELTGANLLTIIGAIDAATLNGSTSAQIQTAVINAITNGASAAYDTLVEIQALMEADDTQTADMLTSIGLRARFKDLAIPSGATPQVVNHQLALGNIGSWNARCYIAASGLTEEYEITPTDGNNFSISDESGAAIPAGRRIFITAGV